MRINCLSCGHKVELDDAYSDYNGQVKCFTCNALLEIITEQGSIKSVRVLQIVPRAAVWQTFESHQTENRNAERMGGF